MTIFAARLVLPPDLIDAGEGVVAAQKETGPEAVASARECSRLLRMVERLPAGARAVLKSMPRSWHLEMDCIVSGRS